MNNYTYEVIEDGYYILNNGKRIIEQRGNFADVVLPGKSYEENAQAHIAQLIETENTPNEIPLDERNRADIDYILMTMGE